MAIFSFQFEMFAIMLIGYILAKANVINGQVRKGLIDIIMYLVLPCSTIIAFNIKLDMEIIVKATSVFLISFLIQLLYLFFNKFSYSRFEKEEKKIVKYATIVSNSGFLGLPLLDSLYGSTALLYGSIALIPTRIAMWTSGLSIFSDEKENIYKKILLHPCVVAIYIGLGLMILKSNDIMVPNVLLNLISRIGSSLTLLSMLVIGSLLIDIKLEDFLEYKLIKYSFNRLVLFPVLVYVSLSSLGLDKLVIQISVILVSMPAGPTVAMLSEKYKSDSVFASKIVIVSTFFSLITLPIIISLLN